MLRLVDVCSGLPVAPVMHRSVVRIGVPVALPEGGEALSDVRAMLVADVLTRVLELSGTIAYTGLICPDGADERRAALQVRAAELGIHPAAAHGDERGVEGELGGPFAVRLSRSEEAPDEADGDVIRLAVADAHATDGVAERADDPLALRLALLTEPRTEPLRLAPASVSVAHHTLLRWRHAVATWADSPSRPMPGPARDSIRDCLEDDLDLPGVLRTLHRLEHSGDAPAGALFETFAYVDRVLGLDLVRDVGRGPAPPRPLT
ncbi:MULTISPECIES: hypothetical protein [unclassified Streptomyces]|uniref:hypothetical protein n=1 Tax=unclassified Streptomyces TaxID=2593676 RepID=UPI002E31F03A|nr:hypothetical protein [Streptomyces sp. NBC_01280]WSE12952.1 hypothetical protein OG518_06310 [Streptomyces sp. NBC_01397]